MNQDDDAPLNATCPADEVEKWRARAWQRGGDLAWEEHPEMDDTAASRQLHAGDDVTRALRVTLLPLADRLDVVVVGDGDDADRAVARGVAPLLGMKQPITALRVQVKVGVGVTLWRNRRNRLLVDPDWRQHRPLVEVLADQ